MAPRGPPIPRATHALGPRSASETTDPRIAAQAPSAPSRYRLIAEAATDFPLFLGAEVTFELPFRLAFGGGVGGVPTSYLRVTGDAVVAVADLEGAEADLVTEALSGSWAGRLFIAWRPRPDAGFYLRVGYTALNLSGQMDSADAIAATTALPTTAAEGGVARLRSTLHGIDAQIGYRWHLGSVTVRLGLGFFATVGSAATIDVDSPLNPELTDELSRLGEDYLEDIYQSYVFTPSLGLGIGYDIGL